MIARIPTRTARRRLLVRHVTRYQYACPVTRSTHTLRLRPAHDAAQAVLRHRLTVNLGVSIVEYEDVFGNRAARFDVAEPYTELVVTSESLVAVSDLDPAALNPSARPIFPAVWMPWEQQMLSPYLTPAELPEPQLMELHEYAAGFVRRNGGDLLEALLDLNRTFYSEYAYAPGTTHLGTTPFEVYTSRRGVCQDFAHLFICLSRLVGIPARYVCGYIWTGNTGQSRARSDATHAWVEAYLPGIGWRGFDPTNGVLPGRDHVRVAVGRHYKDATPTCGTLFTSSPEWMSVEVEVADAPAKRHRRGRDRGV